MNPTSKDITYNPEQMETIQLNTPVQEVEIDLNEGEKTNTEQMKHKKLGWFNKFVSMFVGQASKLRPIFG
jgi:hypothetical protein